MSDRMTAWLRTVVPGAWAALIVWAASQAEWLPMSVTEWLSSEATVVVVIGLVIGAWHWAWTKIGPHIPDWVETIVMGHTGVASYNSTLALFEPYTSATGDPMVRVTTTNPDGTIATEEHFTDH